MDVPLQYVEKNGIASSLIEKSERYHNCHRHSCGSQV